jgi:hypothetical protein
MGPSSLRPPDSRIIRALYAIGLGPLVGRLILLLTTTGRRTGRPRADWVRNLIANPEVEVRVRSRRFRGRAEPISDPERIADFLALRLRRHPRMVGKIMEMQGLTASPTREQLLDYATRLALIIVKPAD